MKIEHVALQVSDPAAIADWYVQHLGCSVALSSGEPLVIRFLMDGSRSAMIELYRNPLQPVPDYASVDPILIHLAFLFGRHPGRSRSAGRGRRERGRRLRHDARRRRDHHDARSVGPAAATGQAREPDARVRISHEIKSSEVCFGFPGCIIFFWPPDLLFTIRSRRGCAKFKAGNGKARRG